MTPAHAPGIVVADLDRDLVLHDRTGARFHVLDHSSALVWRCFDGVATVDEIVGDIVEVFGADEATVRDYVDTLVTLLAERGLLVDAPLVEAGLIAGADRPGAATDRPVPVHRASASCDPGAAPA